MLDDDAIHHDGGLRITNSPPVLALAGEIASLALDVSGRCDRGGLS